MRADGRAADRHNEANIRFTLFCERAPKKEIHILKRQ
jgi:hypothetical protein